MATSADKARYDMEATMGLSQMANIKQNIPRCPECGFPLTREIRWNDTGSKLMLVCTNSTCSYMRPVPSTR